LTGHLLEAKLAVLLFAAALVGTHRP
jgi:hypothetical protein